MQKQSREIPFSAFLAAKAACEKSADFERFLDEWTRRSGRFFGHEAGGRTTGDDDVVVMTIN